jgi:tetratricopeptide (TPR) repeat protein
MTALRVRGVALAFLLLMPAGARAQDVVPAPSDLKVELADFTLAKSELALRNQPPDGAAQSYSVRAYAPNSALKYEPSNVAPRFGHPDEKALSFADDREPSKRLVSAVARFGVGLVDEALADAKIYLSHDPNCTPARRIATLCQISIALRSRQPDMSSLRESATQIAQLLATNPGDPLLQAYRGVLECRLRGDINQAIADLSLAIDKGVAPQATRLGVDLVGYRACAFAILEEYKKAISDFDFVAGRNHSGQPELWVLEGRGRCRAACQQYDAAIADFSAAIQQAPDSPSYYWLRAGCYRAKHDFSRALADLDQIAKLAPTNAQVYVDRAMVLWDMGDTTRAMAEMDHLVALSPKSGGPYFLRAAMAMLVLNDCNRALSDVDRAIALEPRFMLPYMMRAYLHARDKKLIPTCKDLALCAISRGYYDLKLELRIYPDTKRFYFGFRCSLKNQEPKKVELAAGLEDQCVREGMSRLLAAMLRRAS